MAIHPIRVYPDEVLRRDCDEVTSFDEELRSLAENLVETMYAAPGIGLAAPQVGIPIRLCVVDVTVGEQEGNLHVFVNPEIRNREGEVTDVEGCLSIPEFTEKVTRPRSIEIVARDLAGETWSMRAEDWLARAICHEIDHLDGVLFVDHLTGLRRRRAARFLKSLEEEWEEQGTREERSRERELSLSGR